MFLGKEKNRMVDVESTIFEHKSNFFFEVDLFIYLERKIIKKYFLAVVYFILSFRQLYYSIALFMLSTFIYLYFNFEYSFVSFFLLFCIFLLINYFFIYFINFIIYFCELVYFDFFVNKEYKLIIESSWLFNRTLILLLNFFFSIFYTISSMLKNEICNYVSYFRKKYNFYFFFILKFFIFKCLYIFALFIYFIFTVILYLSSYVTILIFFFFTKKFKNYYVNHKKILWLFFTILNIKFKLIIEFYAYLKIEYFLKNLLKYLIKILLFSQFIFGLLFFFNKSKFFSDRFIFYVWDDIRDEDYEYTYWKVNYKYTKYYAERDYFSLNGYMHWMLHIWKYKILIPFSFFVHKWEWELELIEIQTFTLLEYTEIEKTMIIFNKYINYYFLQENNLVNCKNAYFDLCNYVWFFVIEDLFLYYTQLSLIIFYCLNYIIVSIKRYVWKFLFVLFKIYFYILNNTLLLKIKILFKQFKISKRVYIMCNFIQITSIFIFLKIFKIYRKYKKIKKFIFLRKKFSYFLKLNFFSFFSFFSLFMFIKNINNFKSYNLYFYSNQFKLEKFYKLNFIQFKFLRIDYILAKHYKKEEYYSFFKRFFLFKSIEITFWQMQEINTLYDILKSELAKYKNLKSVDKLTWYDRLTGADIGYTHTYNLYKYYVKLKRKHRQKKRNKFRGAKSVYFFFLNKK